MSRLGLTIGIVPPAGSTVALQPQAMALVSALELLQLEWTELRPEAEARDISCLISFNSQRLADRCITSARLPPNRCAVIILEPRATSPESHDRRRLAAFSHRYFGSRLWAREDEKSFPWPQSLDVVPSACSDEFAASLLAGDKRTGVRGGAYSLRRQTAFLCDRVGTSLVVGGPGWADPGPRKFLRSSRSVVRAMSAATMPSIPEAYSRWRYTPRHYAGVVESKAEVLRLAPASLVVENSLDYVSEKVVDVIRHGVVPIYVGPRLSDFGIPEECAIVAAPDARSIVSRINSVSADEVARCRQAGLRWISSESAQNLAMERVMGDLARSIVESLFGGTAVQTSRP